MFTGIVTAIGTIVDVQPLGADAAHGSRLTVETPTGYLEDALPGDSVALNGACMTVTTLDLAARRFTIDISAESLARTAGLHARGTVNLEKAVRPSDRLGGHMVTGHVDGVGTVVHFAPVGESFELRVTVPGELRRFVAQKGSITVNGVSLTVNRLSDSRDACELSINLIPHTLHSTTLGQLAVGQRVNVEIDLIARYVERMLGTAA
jgi:riboflavin synthase